MKLLSKSLLVILDKYEINKTMQIDDFFSDR